MRSPDSGMPGTKIRLLVPPVHIRLLVYTRHIADNDTLPLSLPAIPCQFPSPEHHMLHETEKRQTAFSVDIFLQSFHITNPKTHHSVVQILWFHPKAARYFPVFVRSLESGNPSASHLFLQELLPLRFLIYSFFMRWIILKNVYWMFHPQILPN